MKLSFSYSVLLIAVVLLVGFDETSGQAPAMIPYQAIARDITGNIVANQTIAFRFSIHQNNVNGSVEWQEIQQLTSSQLGVVNTQLGAITNLGNVNWGGGAKFLQVEMDITGGTNYLDMGTQQMMSVPYALYAEASGTPGLPGPSGLNSLIKQSQEAPGTNCPNGGVKIESGLDLNSNTILEADEINSSQTQFVCNGSSISTSLNIGDSVQGGIVFYVDESGQHGMVALDHDLVDLVSPFYSSTTYGPTTSTNVGSGKFNTLILANSYPAPNSAVLVVFNLVENGFDDWYIPSRDELVLLWANLYQAGIGNLVGNIGPLYCSSSYYLQLSGCTTIDYWWHYCGSMNNMQNIVFGGGFGSCYGGTQSAYRVRPVRNF